MDNNFLLVKLQKNGLVTRFTSKGLQNHFKTTENIPKIKTRLAVRDLLNRGIIERRSVLGCSSVCANCYEYGCDAEHTAPSNFYEIVFDWKDILKNGS